MWQTRIKMSFYHLRKDGITEGGESQDPEDKALKDTEVGNRNIGSQGEKAGVQVDIGVISNMNKEFGIKTIRFQKILRPVVMIVKRYRYQWISML